MLNKILNAGVLLGSRAFDCSVTESDYDIGITEEKLTSLELKGFTLMTVKSNYHPEVYGDDLSRLFCLVTPNGESIDLFVFNSADSIQKLSKANDIMRMFIPDIYHKAFRIHQWRITLYLVGLSKEYISYEAD